VVFDEIGCVPGEPATPRPAATVILLRRGGRHRQAALEVLLVCRNPEASFMPGAWVFPGGAVGSDDAEQARRTEAEEGIDPEELAHRVCAVRELAEEAGVTVPVEELRPWSRWITPEAVPVRFDTRFYVALAPPHSPPRPDGSETVDAGWFEPRRALELQTAGELDLVFPTIKHLESLLPHATVDEVLAAAADRRLDPVLPTVVGEGSDRRVVLPREWEDR
jgi:8-oxo-dGTP pyrophosphatase MutT (NUDIX family)